jgi:hypothetical protein
MWRRRLIGCVLAFLGWQGLRRRQKPHGQLPPFVALRIKAMPQIAEFIGLLPETTLCRFQFTT